MLGDNIKKFRKASNLSQEELAERIDVSRQAISRWELGSTLPDAPNLLKLSDLFSVSIDYLLRDDEDETTHLPPTKEIHREPTEKELKQRKYYLVACICWVIAAVSFLIAAIDRMSIHLVMFVFVDVILASVFLWKYIKSEPKE